MFVSDHERNDVRSIRLHQAVAERLRQDPARVIAKARQNLARMREDPHSAYYVLEWDRWLSGPLEDLATMMTADTEYARSLRQATPFAGVLTPNERWAVYRAFREEWTV